MAPDRTGSVRGLTRRSFHRIAFTDWGPASAVRPVLCVHGLTRNGRDFDHLAVALANAGAPRRLSRPAGQGTKRTAAGQQRLCVASVLQRHDRIDGCTRRNGGRLDRHVAGRVDRDGSGRASGQSDPSHRHQRYRTLFALGRIASPRRQSQRCAKVFRDDRTGRGLLPSGSGALRAIGGCALAASDNAQRGMERGGALLQAALRSEHCPCLSKPLALQRRSLEILGCDRRPHPGDTRATIGFAP